MRERPVFPACDDVILLTLLWCQFADVVTFGRANKQLAVVALNTGVLARLKVRQAGSHEKALQALSVRYRKEVYLPSTLNPAAVCKLSDVCDVICRHIDVLSFARDNRNFTFVERELFIRPLPNLLEVSACCLLLNQWNAETDLLLLMIEQTKKEAGMGCAYLPSLERRRRLLGKILKMSSELYFRFPQTFPIDQQIRECLSYLKSQPEAQLQVARESGGSGKVLAFLNLVSYL